MSQSAGTQITAPHKQYIFQSTTRCYTTQRHNYWGQRHENSKNGKLLATIALLRKILFNSLNTGNPTMMMIMLNLHILLWFLCMVFRIAVSGNSEGYST